MFCIVRLVSLCLLVLVVQIRQLAEAQAATREEKRLNVDDRHRYILTGVADFLDLAPKFVEDCILEGEQVRHCILISLEEVLQFILVTSVDFILFFFFIADFTVTQRQ